MLVQCLCVCVALLQVSYIISDIQAGAVGTQACNDAVLAISGIVGDLETTAMFCTASALPESAQSGKCVYYDSIFVSILQ